MDRAMTEGQQAHGHFQQQQARAAERAVRQRQRDFADDLVIDPRLAVGRPRIRVGAREMAGVQKFLAEEDVAPEVNVGGVFGELENGEANHANDERPRKRELSLLARFRLAAWPENTRCRARQKIFISRTGKNE